MLFQLCSNILHLTVNSLNLGVTCDSVVWSPGWVKPWEGLLSVVVTDFSTTWAEVIIRVKWLPLRLSKLQWPLPTTLLLKTVGTNRLHYHIFHFPNYSDLPLLSSLFRLFPKIACMQQAPPSLRWKFLITWTLDSGYSKTSVPCTTCRQLVSYTKRFTKGVAIRCVLDTYSIFLTLESHDSSTKFYRWKRKFKTFALGQ